MKKGFDCVRMKHEIQEAIMAETEGMKPGEEVEYYRRKMEQMADLWEKMKASCPPPEWVRRRRGLNP
jgi:hypothetical protein